MNAQQRKMLSEVVSMTKGLAADIQAFNSAHGASPKQATQSGPPEKPRPVKLQVNTTGAWRNVLDFDCADSARVLPAAAELFAGSKCTLRVIMPGDTAPLMYWTPERGWVEWADR